MNSFLDIYPAKITEYLLAISYLVLFVGYWRWVMGEKAPGAVPDAKHGRRS